MLLVDRSRGLPPLRRSRLTEAVDTTLPRGCRIGAPERPSGRWPAKIVINTSATPSARTVTSQPGTSDGRAGGSAAMKPPGDDGHGETGDDMTGGRTGDERTGDGGTGGVPLSEREEQVLLAVTNGSTNTEIAADLHLSVSTVKAHVASLLVKVGVRNRVELAVWAVRTGRLDR